MEGERSKRVWPRGLADEDGSAGPAVMNVVRDPSVLPSTKREWRRRDGDHQIRKHMRAEEQRPPTRRCRRDDSDATVFRSPLLDTLHSARACVAHDCREVKPMAKSCTRAAAGVLTLMGLASLGKLTHVRFFMLAAHD